MAQDSDIPTGGAAGGSDAQPPRPAGGLDARIDRLLDAVHQRDRQVDRLLSELAKFPAAAENLGESVQVQVDLANSLDELLAGLADRNEELAGMVRSASETAAEQATILQKLQDRLAARDQTNEEIADALRRLAGALDRAPSDYAKQLEMMEQIRGHLGRAGVALEKTSTDLSKIADRGRQDTAAAIERLSAALERAPKDTAALGELLERMHQTHADHAAALADGVERLRRHLDQADAASTGNVQALTDALRRTVEELSQANARQAEHAARLLSDLAVTTENTMQLVQRQNRLLAWLLGLILLVLVGLAAFLLARPGLPGGAPPVRSGPPATQPVPAEAD